ncbi:hypothetical protein M413DRAFT_352588 [Hebeloma cylindrosporum]|uniref:Uncharacterized protein n=1 Tax=Hebeloma cylindrosporum TaxID=76867 RepID=A0A0C3CKU6_HEBCY|nr:hypothetical protein M413DRAFT_352588 [Hebeloma cylindrosporum h7]
MANSRTIHGNSNILVFPYLDLQCQHLSSRPVPVLAIYRTFASWLQPLAIYSSKKPLPTEVVELIMAYMEALINFGGSDPSKVRIISAGQRLEWEEAFRPTFDLPPILCFLFDSPTSFKHRWCAITALPICSAKSFDSPLARQLSSRQA